MIGSRLAGLLLAAGFTAALAACGGSGNSKATPTSTRSPATATAAALSTPAAGTPAAPTASPTPFVGGRAPVVGSLGFLTGNPPPGQLVDVRAAGQNGYDRVTFEFRSGAAPPDYRVEYVTSPAQCASGQAVALTNGQAALQVKFTPADAHDAQAHSTVIDTAINPGLPSIIAAQQTCDFEADVTWVVILKQQVDFRVTALTDPYRLAVDVAQP